MIRSLGPDDQYLHELRRPWKLCSFAAGMAWLFYGALSYKFADWDLGVSVLMGGLTYLCAPWTVSTIVVCLRERPRYWLLWVMVALGVAWAVIDGSYTVYNKLMRHGMDRAANFPASAAFYFLAGVIWSYRGPLRKFVQDLHLSRGGTRR
jgi:hypothetical protein